MDGISPLALHAKASILFKEASSVSREGEPVLLRPPLHILNYTTVTDLSPSITSPVHLGRIIDTLTSGLPLLGQLDFSDTLLTTHILAYGATLKLAMTYTTHKSATPQERDDARRKCVGVALRIARCLSEFGIGKTGGIGIFVDPILVVRLSNYLLGQLAHCRLFLNGCKDAV